MEYTSIRVFIKDTNLSEYFSSNIEECASNHNMDLRSAEDMECLHKRYSKEQIVQLIAQFKFENGKIFCRIRCPINPLPVRGWFETPSVHVLTKSLISMGWIPIHTLNNKVLK